MNYAKRRQEMQKLLGSKRVAQVWIVVPMTDKGLYDTSRDTLFCVTQEAARRRCKSHDVVDYGWIDLNEIPRSSLLR